MTPAEILKKARALISAPERWTQACGARTATGRSVGSVNPDAVCWCAYGAIMVSDPSGYLPAAELMETVVASRYIGIGSWNDDPKRTHAEVLAGFDAAIALAESQERA